VGRHFDREVIVQVASDGYLRFRLRYRDLVEDDGRGAVSSSSKPQSCAECGVMFLSLSGGGNRSSRPAGPFLAGWAVSHRAVREMKADGELK